MSTATLTPSFSLSPALLEKIDALNVEARDLEEMAKSLEIQARDLRHEAEFLAMNAQGQCQRCQWLITKDTIRWEGACGIPIRKEWCTLGECHFAYSGEASP